MAEEIQGATTQNSAADSSLLTSTTTEPQQTATTQATTDDTKQTSTDAKDDGKGDEGKKPEGEAQKAGAPEKYEFTAPDGIPLDAKAIESFEPVARELNLSQEQAQKLVDLQASFVQQQMQAQIDVWTNTRKQWVETVKADKEIGGQNLDTSLTEAKKVIEKFGTPEVKKALDEFGMGDHPEFIRMLSRIGKAMSEDKFHAGSAATSVPPEVAFFPTMFKK